jgi:hypothetical protein
MPVVLQVEAPREVTSSPLQLAVQVEQAAAAILTRSRGGAERQGLQHPQDLAHVAQLGGVQYANPKAASKRRVEHALANQAQQGLPNGRAAHPHLAGQGHVPNSAPGREIATLDLGQDAVIDLVTEWDA